MIFTNYILPPVSVCKVKSACTNIKPVKRLTVNSIYSLKIFFYATLDSHIPGSSNNSSCFWFYWNCCRCCFHCQNSVFHFYYLIPYFINSRWFSSCGLINGIRIQRIGKPKVRKSHRTIESSSGLFLVLICVLRKF